MLYVPTLLQLHCGLLKIMLKLAGSGQENVYRLWFWKTFKKLSQNFNAYNSRLHGGKFFFSYCLFPSCLHTLSSYDVTVCGKPKPLHLHLNLAFPWDHSLSLALCYSHDTLQANGCFLIYLTWRQEKKPIYSLNWEHVL